MMDVATTTTLGDRGRGRGHATVVEDGAELIIRTVLDSEVRSPEGWYRGTEPSVEERRVPRPAALLRVNTAALGSYHEGRDGHVWALGGAFVLAEGLFASGAAGRCGTAPDVLVGLRSGEPGAVVALSYGHMRAVAWAWDGTTVRECRELADVPVEARPVLAAAVARLYRRRLLGVTGGWVAVTSDGRRVPVTGVTPLSQEREWERSGHIFWGVVLRLEDGTLRFLGADEALQDEAGAEVALGAGHHAWCGWLPGTRATWVDSGADAPAGASWWEGEFARQEAEAAAAAAADARRIEAGAPEGAIEVTGVYYPGTAREAGEAWYRPSLGLAFCRGGEHVLSADVRPAPGVDPAAGPWIGGIEVEWPAGWTGRVLGLELTRGYRRWYGLGLRALVWRTGDAAGTVTGPAEAEGEELGWVLPDPPEPTPVPAGDAAAALAAAWGARARTGR